MSLEAVLDFGRTIHLVRNDARVSYHNYLESSFKKCGARFLVTDDNPEDDESLSACIAWGVDNGLLLPRSKKLGKDRVTHRFYLTRKGKKEFAGQS